MIQARQSAWVRSGYLGEIINQRNETQQDQLGSQHSRQNLNVTVTPFILLI